jgi:hypothetical protein
MLLRSALVAMFALPALISGGQIPAVNGTTGGVPLSLDAQDLAEAASGDASTPRTPGKLRVVENSGVCGGVILFVMHPLSYSHFFAETTPGVYQASGYGDLSANKSMWFVLHLECSLCFYLISTKQVLVLCCT